MSTKKQRDGGKNGQKSGMNFEKKFRKKHGGRELVKQKDFWGEKKTHAKTDSINPDGNRYSIKNPETAAKTVQAQLCSVERFCRRFGITGSLRILFHMFFGADPQLLTKKTYKNRKIFEHVCKTAWGIDTKNLCDDSEIRRCRLKADNVKGMENIVKWFKENIVEVTKFALSESFNNTNNVNAIANKMAWATIKDDLDSVRVFDIEEIVKKVASLKSSEKCYIKNSRTVLRVGILDLQMKGSSVGAPYHDMQFRCSYNQIKKLLNDEGGQI